MASELGEGANVQHSESVERGSNLQLTVDGVNQSDPEISPLPGDPSLDSYIGDESMLKPEEKSETVSESGGTEEMTAEDSTVTAIIRDEEDTGERTEEPLMGEDGTNAGHSRVDVSQLHMKTPSNVSLLPSSLNTTVMKPNSKSSMIHSILNTRSSNGNQKRQKVKKNKKHSQNNEEEENLDVRELVRVSEMFEAKKICGDLCDSVISIYTTDVRRKKVRKLNKCMEYVSPSPVLREFHEQRPDLVKKTRLGISGDWSVFIDDHLPSKWQVRETKEPELRMSNVFYQDRPVRKETEQMSEREKWAGLSQLRRSEICDGWDLSRINVAKCLSRKHREISKRENQLLHTNTWQFRLKHSRGVINNAIITAKIASDKLKLDTYIKTGIATMATCMKSGASIESLLDLCPTTLTYAESLINHNREQTHRLITTLMCERQRNDWNVYKFQTRYILRNAQMECECLEDYLQASYDQLYERTQYMFQLLSNLRNAWLKGKLKMSATRFTREIQSERTAEQIVVCEKAKNELLTVLNMTHYRDIVDKTRFIKKYLHASKAMDFKIEGESIVSKSKQLKKELLNQELLETNRLFKQAMRLSLVFQLLRQRNIRKHQCEAFGIAEYLKDKLFGDCHMWIKPTDEALFEGAHHAHEEAFQSGLDLEKERWNRKQKKKLESVKVPGKYMKMMKEEVKRYGKKGAHGVSFADVRDFARQVSSMDNDTNNNNKNNKNNNNEFDDDSDSEYDSEKHGDDATDYNISLFPHTIASKFGPPNLTLQKKQITASERREKLFERANRALKKHEAEEKRRREERRKARRSKLRKLKRGKRAKRLERKLKEQEITEQKRARMEKILRMPTDDQLMKQQRRKQRLISRYLYLRSVPESNNSDGDVSGTAGNYYRDSDDDDSDNDDLFGFDPLSDNELPPMRKQPSFKPQRSFIPPVPTFSEALHIQDPPVGLYRNCYRDLYVTAKGVKGAAEGIEDERENLIDKDERDSSVARLVREIVDNNLEDMEDAFGHRREELEEVFEQAREIWRKKRAEIAKLQRESHSSSVSKSDDHSTKEESEMMEKWDDRDISHAYDESEVIRQPEGFATFTVDDVLAQQLDPTELGVPLDPRLFLFFRESSELKIFRRYKSLLDIRIEIMNLLPPTRQRAVTDKYFVPIRSPWFFPYSYDDDIWQWLLNHCECVLGDKTGLKSAPEIWNGMIDDPSHLDFNTFREYQENRLTIRVYNQLHLLKNAYTTTYIPLQSGGKKYRKRAVKELKNIADECYAKSDRGGIDDESDPVFSSYLRSMQTRREIHPSMSQFGMKSGQTDSERDDSDDDGDDKDDSKFDLDEASKQAKEMEGSIPKGFFKKIEEGIRRGRGLGKGRHTPTVDDIIDFDPSNLYQSLMKDLKVTDEADLDMESDLSSEWDSDDDFSTSDFSSDDDRDHDGGKSDDDEAVLSDKSIGDEPRVSLNPPPSKRQEMFPVSGMHEIEQGSSESSSNSDGDRDEKKHSTLSLPRKSYERKTKDEQSDSIDNSDAAPKRLTFALPPSLDIGEEISDEEAQELINFPPAPPARLKRQHTRGAKSVVATQGQFSSFFLDYDSDSSDGDADGRRRDGYKGREGYSSDDTDTDDESLSSSDDDAALNGRGMPTLYSLSTPKALHTPKTSGGKAFFGGGPADHRPSLTNRPSLMKFDSGASFLGGGGGGMSLMPVRPQSTRASSVFTSASATRSPARSPITSPQRSPNRSPARSPIVSPTHRSPMRSPFRSPARSPLTRSPARSPRGSVSQQPRGSMLATRTGLAGGFAAPRQSIFGGPRQSVIAAAAGLPGKGGKSTKPRVSSDVKDGPPGKLERRGTLRRLSVSSKASGIGRPAGGIPLLNPEEVRRIKSHYSSDESSDDESSSEYYYETGSEGSSD